MRIAEYQTRDLVAFYGDTGDIVLGNFFIYPITYNGVTYRCAEAAFQAQKDSSRQSEFVNLDGGSAFRLGREVRCRNDWNNIKYKIMMDVLLCKFSDPKLKGELEKTGYAYIIEHCPKKGKDTYWSDDYDGTGKNMLGKLLMGIRKMFFNVPIPKCPGEYWNNIANKQFNNLCVKCGINAPNPGYKWCQVCYNQSKGIFTNTTKCRNCHMNAPNPGYKWCQTCYNQSRTSQNNQNQSRLPYQSFKFQIIQKARCSRVGCPCNSWNGKSGEFCCITCRNGNPCRGRYHI